MNGEKLWGIESVADYLGIPKSSVYKMTAARGREQIPHVKLGGLLRFRKADIDRWLDLLAVLPIERDDAEARAARHQDIRTRSLVRWGSSGNADAPTSTSIPEAKRPAPLFAVKESPVSSQIEASASQVEFKPEERPTLPETRRPGNGGPEHTYLQELIKRWGEEHGFRAAVEEQIAGGNESIDVALYRGDTRIACEVSVTTPLDYEVGNVQKCLAAGFGSVAVVSLKKKRLEQLGKLLSESLPPEQRGRVHLFTPEELLSWLAGQPIEEEAGTVRGYKVKVQYRDPGDDRLKRVAAILSRSMSGLTRDE